MKPHRKSAAARRRAWKRRRSDRFRALHKRDPYSRGERPDLDEQQDDKRA